MERVYERLLNSDVFTIITHVIDYSNRLTSFKLYFLSFIFYRTEYNIRENNKIKRILMKYKG